jgi:hypothetical protein
MGHLGAYNVGMKTCWINREKESVNEQIDAKPDYTFYRLEDVKRVLFQGQEQPRQQQSQTKEEIPH